MLVHVVGNTSHTMTLHLALQNARVEIGWHMTSFPTTYFQRLTLSCLSPPLIHDRNDLSDEAHELRALFNHSCLEQMKLTQICSRL